jgi:hypothetical protein
MADTAQAQLPTSASAVIRLNADPLGWSRLPKPTKITLRRLRRERDDAWRSWRAIADEQREFWDAKGTVEARLKALTGGRPDSAWFAGDQHSRFRRLPDDDPQVASELEKLKDVVADLGRLGPLVGERLHRLQQFNRLLESVENYLNGPLGAVGAIKLHKGPAPSPQKRETAIEAIERCRRRLRELNADRHRIASAPWPSTEAKWRARAEIEALAERGQPSVLPLIESSDGSINWAERPCTDVIVANRLVSAFGDPAGMPLLFWLHREAIISKIEQKIDQFADDSSSLTGAQRREQIDEIDRDRLAVQRDEEHWVSKAVDQGITALRRPDADPRAVLALSDDMPAPMNT